MKTNIKATGDLIIVTLDGKLDYEAQEPLKKDLRKIIEKSSRSGQDTSSRKIIFNMDKLEFVGSSGITSFVQTLKDFSNKTDLKPRYCHVKMEFQKIMKAYDEEESIFEFFENEDRAKTSFDC